MKFRVLTLVASLALASAVFSSALADEVSDPLSGMTSLGDAQLNAATGSNPVLSHQNFSESESSSFGVGSPVTSSSGNLGGVGASQTQNLTGATANLGTGILGPVTGPINMGLNYVGNDIGTELPTLPQ